uniref:protein acetyllysine N-acetyltransferase n=1 Tax=Cacopsylla melanoneura TaxID=428564 RepID=A0A8D8YKA6_9HEMI
MSQVNLRTSTLKRKASQNLTFAAKRAKKVSCKKLISIFQKKEEDRTPNEKQLILESSESIGSLKQRLKRINEVKSRHEELEDEPDILAEKCKQLADAIQNARHVVVYTGAGISTAAKIPDYRGTEGIWTLLQQGKDIGNHDLSLAEPTLTHMALYKLYRHGLINHVVSQNCDNLHLRSGLPRSVLSEVHGNMSVEVCAHCEPVRYYWRVFDVTEHTARYAHQTARKCSCGEPLLDTIIHFGEKGVLLWPLNWSGANKNAEKTDLILCVGSSLKVLRKYYWLWGLDRPKRDRPKLIIVNLQWTPKDDQATLKINGKCDDVFKRVLSHLNLRIPAYDKLRDPIFYHSSHLIQPEFHTVRKPMLDLPDQKYFGKYENCEHALDSFRQLETYQNTTVFVKEEEDEDKVKVEDDGIENNPDVKEEQDEVKNEDDLRNSKRKRSCVKVEQDDEDVRANIEEDEKVKKEEIKTMKTEICLKSKIKQELDVDNDQSFGNCNLTNVISDEQNGADSLRVRQVSKIDSVENVHCESKVSYKATKSVKVQNTSSSLNNSPVQYSHSDSKRTEQLRSKLDSNDLDTGNSFTEGTTPNVHSCETKTTPSTSTDRSNIKSILKNFRRVKKSDHQSLNSSDSTALDGNIKTTPSASKLDSNSKVEGKCTIKSSMQVEKQASFEGNGDIAQHNQTQFNNQSNTESGETISMSMKVLQRQSSGDQEKADSSTAIITSTNILPLPSVPTNSANESNVSGNPRTSKGSFSTLVSSSKDHVKCACRSEMDLTRPADANSNMSCSCANDGVHASDPSRKAKANSKLVHPSDMSTEVSKASADSLSQEKTPRYGSIPKGSVVGVVKPFQKVVDTPTAADSSNNNNCTPVQCGQFIGQTFVSVPTSDKPGLVTTSVMNSQQTGLQPSIGNALPLVADQQLSINSSQPLPLPQSFIPPHQMFSIIPSNPELLQQPLMQPPGQLLPQLQPFLPVSQQQQLLQSSVQQQQSFPQPLLPLLMNSPGLLSPHFSLLQPQFLTGMPTDSMSGGAFQILSTDMSSFPNQNSVIYLQPFPIAAQEMTSCMSQQIASSCLPYQIPIPQQISQSVMPQQISPNLLLVPPSNASVNTIPFSLSSTSTPLSSTNLTSNISTDSYCSPSNTMYSSQPILNSIQPLSQPSLLSIPPDHLMNTMSLASQNQLLNTMSVASQNQLLNTMSSQSVSSSVPVMDTGQMTTPVSNTVLGLTTNMSLPSNTIVGSATSSSLDTNTGLGTTINASTAPTLTNTPILASNNIPVTPIIGSSSPMGPTNNTQMVPKVPLLSVTIPLFQTPLSSNSSSIPIQSSSVVSNALSLSPTNSPTNTGTSGKSPGGNTSVTTMTSNGSPVSNSVDTISSNNYSSLSTSITSNVSTAVVIKTSNGEMSNTSPTEIHSVSPHPSRVRSMSPIDQSQSPTQGNVNTSPVSNSLSPRVISSIRSPNSLTVRSPLMRSPLTPVVSPLKRIRTIRPFQFKHEVSPPEDLMYCSSQDENNSGTLESKGAMDKTLSLVKPRALFNSESAPDKVSASDRKVKEEHSDSEDEKEEDEKPPVEQVGAEKKKRGRKANPNKEEKEKEIYHYSLPQACEFCLQNYQSEVCLFYERQSTLSPTGRRKVVCNCCADQKAVEENVAVLPTGNAGWYGKGYRKGMRKKRSV